MCLFSNISISMFKYLFKERRWWVLGVSELKFIKLTKRNREMTFPSKNQQCITHNYKQKVINSTSQVYSRYHKFNNCLQWNSTLSIFNLQKSQGWKEQDTIRLIATPKTATHLKKKDREQKNTIQYSQGCSICDIANLWHHYILQKKNS